MLGRVEQENKIKKNIDDKLSTLPSIFTDFYNYMESDQKSYITMKHYIDYVSDFMIYINCTKNDNEFYKVVTVQQLREYIVSLRCRTEDGKDVRNADSTQATRWSALNAFFNFLVMDDYIEVNPMTKTKRPKNKKQTEIVYLERDEISTLLNTVKANAKKMWVNRDLAIITLGISTGLRVGAIVAINLSDIDFKNNTIRVIEKGAKDRLIRFGDNTRAILSQWILDRNSYFDNLETDALFISQHRQRITTTSIRRLFVRYTGDVDKHITPHTMRKTAATQACQSGTDINTIASMLGHNSITTTQKYMAVVDRERDKTVNMLDNLC